MASYATHKTGAEGKAQTLERKAARMGKRSGLYLPVAASAHAAFGVTGMKELGA